MSEPVPSNPAKHSKLDDAQGLLTGSFMAAVGIAILTQLGFVTGQTAGLAILISYATGWGFGPVFFAVNLPFYWFGYKRLGLMFTLKSFIAVGLLSLLAMFMPGWIRFETLDPFIGAAFYGVVTGWALLALFRHGASLGGIGILALYLQDKTGFRAGFTQLIFDIVLFATALLLRDPVTIAFSVLGSVVLNLVIAINHRRDRYVGT